MKILICLSILTLCYSLPRTLALVAKRRELPVNWTSGVCFLSAKRLHRNVCAIAQLIGFAISLLIYGFNWVRSEWKRGEVGFLAPMTMILLCLIGYLLVINWLDAHGLNWIDNHYRQ